MTSCSCNSIWRFPDFQEHSIESIWRPSSRRLTLIFYDETRRQLDRCATNRFVTRKTPLSMGEIRSHLRFLIYLFHNHCYIDACMTCTSGSRLGRSSVHHSHGSALFFFALPQPDRPARICLLIPDRFVRTVGA